MADSQEEDEFGLNMAEMSEYLEAGICLLYTSDAADE